jgi:hypothetical protein
VQETIEMTQLPAHSINVEDMLHAFVPMLRVVAGDQILVTSRARAQGYQLRCNVHALESSILSLLLHARDALPNGGRIRILADPVPSQGNGALPQAGPLICLAVHNNGAQAGSRGGDFASTGSFVDMGEGLLDIQGAADSPTVRLYLPATIATGGA